MARRQDCRGMLRRLTWLVIPPVTRQWFTPIIYMYVYRYYLARFVSTQRTVRITLPQQASPKLTAIRPLRTHFQVHPNLLDENLHGLALQGAHAVRRSLDQHSPNLIALTRAGWLRTQERETDIREQRQYVMSESETTHLTCPSCLSCS